MKKEKFYLTKKGLEKIKKEYQDLKELKLAKIRGEEAPQILHSEDLNPEYLAFQEDISFLEARMIELENVLKNTELIKVPPKTKQNIVNLGATILVEVGGQNNELTLVGSLEANPSIGRISDQSPIGKSLLGHRVGDKVEISLANKVNYKIKEIKYNIA